MVVVIKGPIPSKPSSGFSVLVSRSKGGFVGGRIGGLPGNPGNSGSSAPDPPIPGGGNPIPPIKSDVGLSV